MAWWVLGPTCPASTGRLRARCSIRKVSVCRPHRFSRPTVIAADTPTTGPNARAPGLTRARLGIEPIGLSADNRPVRPTGRPTRPDSTSRIARLQEGSGCTGTPGSSTVTSSSMLTLRPPLHSLAASGFRRLGRYGPREGTVSTSGCRQRPRPATVLEIRWIARLGSAALISDARTQHHGTGGTTVSCVRWSTAGRLRLPQSG
jgi:hypothetical protein